LDSALDYATENGAFDFAFELSRFSDKYKLDEIYYKHAMFLEDEGKFKLAQDAFILAGKPREAILMHIHNQDWDLALQVAEAYDTNSVVDVLIGQANIHFTKGEFSKSESLLLRAQRPEIAIKFYKDSNKWGEAIRFAKQHVPNKVGEVQADYDLYLSGQNDFGKDNILANALQLEQSQEYARAIDMYMKLNSTHTKDFDLLEEKWERAVDLALKYLPENAPKIVSGVCRLLIDIKRNSAAADLFCAAELYKEAIDALIAGDLWEKARKILLVAPKYKDYVEISYQNNLKSSSNADALMGPDLNGGIEAYAARGSFN
jgi:intraflagellar transport protein 172